MKAMHFTMEPLNLVDFSIRYVNLDAISPLNQSEPHIHKECEIYLNLSGDVAFEVENRMYPVKRGSVIITRPYEYHHCIYRSNQVHKHYWITFSADKNETFLKMFFDREKGEDNLIILEEENLDRVCVILEDMLNKDTDPLQQRIDFLQFIHILDSSKREGYIVNSPDYLPIDVSTAIQYMYDNLTENLDINEIAQKCNVSVNTLERHFKESLQMTPFATLRKLRMIRSLDYLRKGYSVADAASFSGFPDYSNFIQLFRKQFGMTPFQYKKNYKYM